MSLNLIKLYQKQSSWYKGTTTGVPVGICFHDTGCNNNTLKRYVQPNDDDANRAEMLAKIGTNYNKNDWNHKAVSAGVNAWIGLLGDGSIATVQAGPWDYRPWGVGSGSNGSLNGDKRDPRTPFWIQFEICEDDLQDGMYFRAVYREAAQLCAYLCREYGISVENIVCHKEAHRQGYASDHGDVEHWWPKLGKTMDDFREEVRREREKEERAMEYKEFKEHMQRFLDEQAQETLPQWAKGELEEAKEAGITDGTAPMSFIPRYQAAIMAKRAAKHE